MAFKENYDNLHLDLLAEQELSRWQRQYRLIEGDRFTYSSNVNTNFMRQAKLIEILRKEEYDIQARINIATSKPFANEDEGNRKSMDNLIQMYDEVFNGSKNKKLELVELKAELYRAAMSDVEKEKLGAKSNMLSDNFIFAKIVTARKQVALYENRLDVMMKRFNVTNSANFQLRQEIDHLLKERANFNEFWGKLLRCLTQGKKFMLDLIESATITYDQREEDCQKLELLLTKTNEELVVYSRDYRNLTRQMDHDLKLEQFLGLKSQIRIMAGLNVRQEKKRQAQREYREKQLMVYKNALQEIEEFCAETNYEKIAEKFKKTDVDNFSLFNYINEINYEAEAISTNLDQLKRNIDAQRELISQREKQQKETIERLESTLDLETQESEKYQKIFQQFETEANASLGFIDSLYKLLGCDNTPLLSLLGEYEVLKPYNVEMYMAMIEKRTKEMMQIVFAKERTTIVEISKAKKAKASLRNIIKPDKPNQEVTPVDTLVPASPCPLCAEKEVVIFLRFFDDDVFLVYADEEIAEKLASRLQIRVPYNRLHPVYRCRLPAAREIRQAKYK